MLHGQHNIKNIKHIFALVNKLHIKHDTQFVYKVTPRSVRVTTVDVEDQNITVSECVSVALVIQHAKRMRCIILSLMDYQALPYFFALTHKRHDFRGVGGGGIIECKMCFDFSLNFCLEHCSF
jgi:hypothetical protein